MLCSFITSLLSRDNEARGRFFGAMSTHVAGVDGTPGGWAVIIMQAGRSVIQKVAALSSIIDGDTDFDIIAIDIPIGLLDAYEIGGRACDRAARKFLGKPRRNSIFPAPVRPVLAATLWDDACVRSRASAPHGKALTKQTFAILPKIREVDELLRTRPELREVVREVHPEGLDANEIGCVRISMMAGSEALHSKGRIQMRETNYNISKSSLLACIARPVHTDAPMCWSCPSRRPQ
jgi:predicted RNase H-like nuclease